MLQLRAEVRRAGLPGDGPRRRPPRSQLLDVLAVSLERPLAQQTCAETKDVMARCRKTRASLVRT